MQLTHITINTGRLKESVSFYQNILGLVADCIRRCGLFLYKQTLLATTCNARKSPF